MSDVKLIATLFLLFAFFLFSQEFSERKLDLSSSDSTRIDYNKLSVSVLAAGMTSAASYYVMKNAWWSNESVDFHFDKGVDLKYAGNMDKFGHFFGGYVVQDLYYRSFVWSNISNRSSILLSFGMSVFTQVMIDLKDGFSPSWGFSVYDVCAGTLGAGYGALQKKYPVLEDYKFKISYFIRNDNYHVDRKWIIEDLIEDYPNQTYWISFPVNNIIPGRSRDIFPDCMSIGFGISIDDEIGIGNSGHYEFYISPDIDLVKLVSLSDIHFLKTIAHYLNYIKFPAPAIRLTPDVKGYWIYF